MYGKGYRNNMHYIGDIIVQKFYITHNSINFDYKLI